MNPAARMISWLSHKRDGLRVEETAWPGKAVRNRNRRISWVQSIICNQQRASCESQSIGLIVRKAPRGWRTEMPLRSSSALRQQFSRPLLLTTLASSHRHVRMKQDRIMSTNIAVDEPVVRSFFYPNFSNGREPSGVTLKEVVEKVFLPWSQHPARCLNVFATKPGRTVICLSTRRPINPSRTSRVAEMWQK
jgi:hypothetical protein